MKNNPKDSGLRARRGARQGKWQEAVEMWGWATAHRCIGKDTALCTPALLRDLQSSSGPPEDQWDRVGLSWDGAFHEPLSPLSFRKASQPFSCYGLVDHTILEVVVITAMEGQKEKGGFALFRSEQAGTDWQGVSNICKF